MVIQAKNLTGDIKSVLMKRYSDRKHDAKKIFMREGGYDNVERARAFHPDDMRYDNWLRTIEGFLDGEYIKRSGANKQVPGKQLFPFRGGTWSYGSTTYKNVMFYICVRVYWVPVYAKTHTDNQRNWVDPVAEQNYQATNEWSGDGPPIGPYQEALGERRGWYRGVGPKSSSNTPLNLSSSQPQT
ncbi:hypothetical protein Hdeb2414_s0007g00230991 [Helianthus debilis subsp. tardiflorus]